MKRTVHIAVALCLALWAGAVPAATPVITNAILFVTQVPMPVELNDSSVSNVTVSVVSALGNHLADTAHAGRGGDLFIRYPNGAISNLTRAAGFGVSGSQDGTGIAVRDPFVHWSGSRALFSMVVGAPTNANDSTTFFWQLYEITNFVTPGSIPVITKVPNQPTNYNNVMGCYGTDGRIIFACDRPRDGSPLLYPQLDEYNNIPSNTGLWSLNPANGDLFLLDHSPSGDFNPFVDSFGRVIFTRWDHLVQDRNATDDRMSRATNGTFNYFSETTTNYDIHYRPNESFPEPRTYDTNLTTLYGVQGNAMNSFFPWMQNEDGTAMETLNHIGRHEMLSGFRGSSFTNDPNLIQQFSLANRLIPGSAFLNNFYHIHEDPTHLGTYFGVDGPDFGTHASGQIITLFGPAGTNGEQMPITYITSATTKNPNATLGLYRNALPLASGSLVASYVSHATNLDFNAGTAAFPKSAFGTYRLVGLTNNGSGVWSAYTNLTSGFTNPVSYWNGGTRVTHTNGLWELQPAEVIGNNIPARLAAAIAPVEAQVFADEGVDVQMMQAWLRSNNLALIISRNVTARDRADKEQPYNLRVPGGVQTLSTNLGNNTNFIYDIAYMQFLQADQLRGLTYGTTNPVPGRRVLATPMHDPLSTSFNVPSTNSLVGASLLGPDGSQATFVPARRAMTHQTVNTNGNEAVRERYWITYQPGEIRTCAVCHGLNVADQAGRPLPTNAPAALRSLLRYWKDQTTPLQIVSGEFTNSGFRLHATGPSSRTNILDYSIDLTNWIPVLTNIPATNTYFLDDPGSAISNRFYRLRMFR